MPQLLSTTEGGRTESEEAEFGEMLDAIADLYLTARVLILMDSSYDSRFWTLMEAWCSMMKVTPHGVRTAEDYDRRYTIVCIHNADKVYDKPKLVKKLSTKSPEEMHDILSKPDIQLTNARDKEKMLPVISKTNEHVKEMLKLTRRLPARLLSQPAEEPGLHALAQSAPAVLRRYSSAPMVEYPNLPLDAYRSQRVFHRINLETPGLQLVHMEPYIFLVQDFLTSSECEKLIALLASSEKRGPSAAPDTNQGENRTSTTVIPEPTDVRWLQDRISELVNVDVALMDATKLTHYAKGEFFGPHTDTDGRAFGKTKWAWWLQIQGLGLETEAAQSSFRAAFDEAGSVGQTPDRFCSVFIYLNDVAQGGRTVFSSVTEPQQQISELAAAFDALHGVSSQEAARAAATVGAPPVPPAPPQPSNSTGVGSLSIVPRRGMAVVHFPTTSASYGCVPDVKTRHESEPAISPKFIVQQFIWSRPRNEVRSAVDAYLRSLVSVATQGEKERGSGGVVLINKALRPHYALPADITKLVSCGKDFISRLQQLVSKQAALGMVVIFEITERGGAKVWFIAREQWEAGSSDVWRHEPGRVKQIFRVDNR